MRKNQQPLIGANPPPPLDLSDFPLINRLPSETETRIVKAFYDEDLDFDERFILRHTLLSEKDFSLSGRYIHETFEAIGSCRAARIMRSLKREGYVVQYQNTNYTFARPARDYIAQFVDPIRKGGIHVLR